jgi:alanine racemase
VAQHPDHPHPDAVPADLRPSAATWIDIDTGALRHNMQTLRRRLGLGPKLGVVVKADAYGHGLTVVAPVIAPLVDWLIVNAADEARAVRAALAAAGQTGASPLYICGPLLPFQAKTVVDARARTVVTDMDVVRALGAASVAAGVITPLHLKVETGTHRQGLPLVDVAAFAIAANAVEGVVVEGVTTHYADIEDTTDHRFADTQRRRLEEARDAMVAAGLPRPMCHSANSAATLLDARTHGDLVRVGIAAYGLWPSRETQAAWLEQRLRDRGTLAPHAVVDVNADSDDDDVPTLQPVMSWRARLTQVKDVPAGGYVGYGRTYRATHASRIAIIPVGYHEGYDRRLSNVGHVIVDGVRCPVRGRVCMNMIMVDVTDVDSARPGTVATLMGELGDERVSAEQLASWMGTIHYEVTSRIHPVVPRLPLP